MERREQDDDEERQQSGASDRLIHRIVASGDGGAVGHGDPAVWPTVDGPLGLSEERSLEYARSFFRWGFLLLPFLWAVNCLYFWPVLRNRSSSSFQHIRPSDLRLRFIRRFVISRIFLVSLRAAIRTHFKCSFFSFSAFATYGAFSASDIDFHLLPLAFPTTETSLLPGLFSLKSFRNCSMKTV